MKNKEKYAKEIVEISVESQFFGFDKNKNIIKPCSYIDCDENCLFRRKIEELHGGCVYARREWANTEYKEPILDGVEKEYLRNVIKPFRDRVRYVIKFKKGERESITIQYLDSKKYMELPLYFINFPSFKKGTMYKGMEIEKEYTLDELGLWWGGKVNDTSKQ